MSLFVSFWGPNPSFWIPLTGPRSWPQAAHYNLALDMIQMWVKFSTTVQFFDTVPVLAVSFSGLGRSFTHWQWYTVSSVSQAHLVFDWYAQKIGSPKFVSSISVPPPPPYYKLPAVHQQISPIQTSFELCQYDCFYYVYSILYRLGIMHEFDLIIIKRLMHISKCTLSLDYSFSFFWRYHFDAWRTKVQSFLWYKIYVIHNSPAH